MSLLPSVRVCGSMQFRIQLSLASLALLIALEAIVLVSFALWQDAFDAPLVPQRKLKPVTNFYQNFEYLASSKSRSKLFPDECGRRRPEHSRRAGKEVDISGNDTQVAICLYGESRQFELTGWSIKTYVLDILPFAHVFLVSPLDRNLYKLSVLSSAKPHFAKAKIFTPDRIPETMIIKELVEAKGASRGLQGLLQFFRLFESCGDIIHEYEKEGKFQYDWIVQLRLDGYWMAPIPTRYEAGVYTVARGSDWGGLNDRIGVGDRATSMVAGLRLSILPSLHAQGDRLLRPEPLFESQLELQRVVVAPKDFAFCHIDHKRWIWPLPVASIGSIGPLNGAYCRACRALVSGKVAASMVESMCKRYAWFPTENIEKLDLCDGSKLAWDEGWEGIFDSTAGSEAAAARSKLGNKTSECADDQAAFQKRWEIWTGPPPEEVCRIESRNPWRKTTPDRT